MLGKSIRFLQAGYIIPKYQLPLGDETVFCKSVRSFQDFFDDTPFVFIIRKDQNALNFVVKEISRLGIKDFRIIEFSYDTKGQAASVQIGIRDYSDDLPLIIFNIDTILNDFHLSDLDLIGDGLLEVFEGEGSSWSFVEPGKGNSVIRTTEKVRISNLCSNGLYFFKTVGLFRKAYSDYVQYENTNGEIYIAPLYNILINSGHDIRFKLVGADSIEHCGLPEHYEILKIKYCNKFNEI